MRQRSTGPVVLVVAALMLAVFLPLAGVVGPARAVEPTRSWLALGDSYSSGEGVNDARDGSADECQRSPSAWPRATAAHANNGSKNPFGAVTFLACTGATLRPISADGKTSRATTDKDSRRQQAEKLASGKFDVISMTFGGNDVGFANKLLVCLGARSGTYLLPLAGPVGLFAAVAADQHGNCGIDESSVKAAIRGLQSELTSLYRTQVAHLKSGGSVIVVGYPHLFAPSNTWALINQATRCAGITSSDADKISRLVDELNATIHDAVKDAGASVTFFPVAELFKTHEVCGTGEDWINSIPTLDANENRGDLFENLSGSMHPNLLGHRAIARQLATSIPAPPSRTARVAFVKAGEVLEVRRDPSSSTSVVGSLGHDRRSILLTGERQQIGDDVWVRVSSPAGWVNSAFLVADVPTKAFCADARVAQTVDKFIDAIRSKNERQIAATLDPDRKVRLSASGGAPLHPVVLPVSALLSTERRTWFELPPF